MDKIKVSNASILLADDVVKEEKWKKLRHRTNYNEFFLHYFPDKGEIKKVILNYSNEKIKNIN
jgi:hypothetical protein